MISIGYKNDGLFHKHAIASTQLSEAINLFIAEKFICSLTLASASEEIFAGLLKSRGQKPIIERSIDKIQEIREKIRTPIMNGKSKIEIIKTWNHAKNRTKHHDKDETEFILFNDCDEAYWMIERALENAKSLNIHIPNEVDFKNWVITKICL